MRRNFVPMIFRLNLQNRIVQAALLILAAIALGLLAQTVVVGFITGTFSDERLAIAPETLRRAAGFYPHSGKMLARLASIESRGGAVNDLARAQADASLAIEQSPRDYRNYLLLASVEEQRGDRANAERALDAAQRLAPHYSDVHWRVANLQMRAGKFDRAVEHFQNAVELNPSLAPATIDLIWNATSGTNLAWLKKVVEKNPREQISLARFLIKRDRIAEAAEILSSVERRAALESWETKPLLYELIAKNRPLLARNLWNDYRQAADATEKKELIWNGDFEGSHLDSFEHFEWHLTNNNFARVSIDDRESHSGANALLLDFLGRDTTRLDTEIKQQIAVRAGGTYQLEFYFKTADFHAPEGPRVAVSDLAGKWIVYAPPVTDSNDEWRRVQIVFTAPRQSPTGETALLISIKRQPKLAYEDPTRGRVWFDDFTLTERGGK